MDFERKFRLFEETFGCKLCVHDYGHFFTEGPAGRISGIRYSHRRTFPEECGRENRKYCLDHCMKALNWRIAESPPRDVFLTHCRRGCVELAAPVYRHGRCVLLIFAGLLDVHDKEKFRRLVVMLPVFASGIASQGQEMRRRNLRPEISAAAGIEDFIQEHYAERISTRDAAKALHLSVSRLCHLLQERGVRFSELLTAARLQYAEGMLRHTDFPVSKVAELCGFPSSEHFSRVFRKGLDSSPGAWRKRSGPVRAGK